MKKSFFVGSISILCAFFSNCFLATTRGLINESPQNIREAFKTVAEELDYSMKEGPHDAYIYASGGGFFMKARKYLKPISL